MRERRHHDGARARAGKIGGALAVADRVDGAAEGRARQQEDRRDADRGPDQQRVRDAEQAVAGGDEAHRRRRRVLRREAAGVHDHQPLRDGVDAERDDHRRHAQEGDADAVDEAERDAAGDAERDRQRHAERPPAGRRGRHHAADGDHPRAPTGRSGRAGSRSSCRWR